MNKEEFENRIFEVADKLANCNANNKELQNEVAFKYLKLGMKTMELIEAIETFIEKKNKPRNPRY